MVTAIFPAAGKGKRMRAGMNKAFMELAGVPILVRTLMKFSRCPAIDQIIVAVAEGEVGTVRHIMKLIPNMKPWQVVVGGPERQHSIWNAIQAIWGYADDDIISVHDAARPLVDERVILETIRVARDKGAAIAAVPAKNTIKVCGDGEVVQSTPDRRTLWEVQTPQVFRRDILVRANEKAIEDGFVGTDDASLVERIGVPVHIVESDYRNIKITTPEDMLIAGALLRENQEKGLLHSGLRFIYKEINKKIRESFGGY